MIKNQDFLIENQDFPLKTDLREVVSQGRDRYALHNIAISLLVCIKIVILNQESVSFTTKIDHFKAEFIDFNGKGYQPAKLALAPQVLIEVPAPVNISDNSAVSHCAQILTGAATSAAFVSAAVTTVCAVFHFKISHFSTGNQPFFNRKSGFFHRKNIEKLTSMNLASFSRCSTRCSFSASFF